MSIIIISIIFSSCNSTKLLQENQYLLIENSISVDSKQIKKGALEPYIQQKPNRTTLIFLRWHLFIHNISKTKKEQRFLKWIGIYKLGEIIGEPPVIIDIDLVTKTKNQFQKYLKTKGYYGSEITSSVTLKNKKAYVKYNIVSNEPYKYKKVGYSFKDITIREVVLADTSKSLIKQNNLLDVDILEKERSRITRVMHDSGYYFFGNQHIHYEIDTAFKSNTASVNLIIEKYAENITGSNYIETNHKKYKINKIIIITNYNLQESISLQDQYLSSFDTTVIKNAVYYFKPDYLVSPKSISRHIYIKNNAFYKLSTVKETYRHLSSLGTFKIVNIKFSKTKGKDNYLDCTIFLTPFGSQSYITELEGTNSAGNLGVAGSFQYQHKSIFLGAEMFSFKIKGGIESQSNVSDNNNEILQAFNSKEIGVESSLRFPMFLLPIRTDNFVRHNAPKTIISASYNFQHRPDYIKTINSARFGYLWKSINYFRHNFNLIEISTIKVPYKNNLFISQVLNRNTGLKRSFEDQFITATNYIISYTNQNRKKPQNYFFIRFFTEASGNILQSYNKTFTKNTAEPFQIFDQQFSQYVKTDVDFRYYNIKNKNSKTAYRIFGGIGYPYGNAEVLPYEKQYFSGGANGLRGWQIRSLGPGSYYSSDELMLYQTADLKLEANFEYRFKLFWLIEGALFTDAGNVWSINKIEDREGASFNMSTFYKDIAVDGGLGARLNFSFFILRFDYGLKFRDPKQPEGERWLILDNQYDFFSAYNGVFNFSIGYPF